MGSKKKKSNSAPMSSHAMPAPEIDDDGLLDDLMATIDGGDAASQAAAASVVQQVEINKAEEIEASSSKKDSRARFEARKVRPCPL
jgi:hypothetical protein